MTLAINESVVRENESETQEALEARESRELTLLIELAQNGCERSIEQLFNRYFFRVSAFVRRYVDSQDVEDVAQETFIRVFKHLGNLKESKAFEGYLFQAAKNACVSWLRKKKRLQSMLEVMWHAATHWQESSGAVDQRKAAAVDALMESLPETSQKYIHMFYVEKRSRAEMAAMMNESTSSAYRKLAAAKAQLIAEAERMNLIIVFTGRHDMAVKQIEAKP